MIVGGLCWKPIDPQPKQALGGLNLLYMTYRVQTPASMLIMKALLIIICFLCASNLHTGCYNKTLKEEHDKEKD